MNEIKLSIIMPCYNVEKTLERALNSIFMQEVDFDYEIIIQNDCSTDKTLNIAKRYAKNNERIKIFNNDKNLGNAKTFYNALCQTKGNYFCVLDGDDYYTVQNKLAKQIKFLDDDVNEEYVATASHYIIDLGGDQMHIPNRQDIREFNYIDFITQNSGYYHTSTYIYRNIFKDNVLEFFKENIYRGDTPRTTFHLMYSGKKVKVMDFVGSAYVFESNGIWSSLKEKEQFEYQIKYLNEHIKNVTSDFEKDRISALITYYENRRGIASEECRKYTASSIDDCLINIQKLASNFAFSNRYVFNATYYSSYIDSLLASIGYVWRLKHPEYIQTQKNNNNICIVNGVLKPGGGGIYNEILQIVNCFRNKTVYLFVTNMETLDEDLKNSLNKIDNLRLVFKKKSAHNRFDYFSKKLVKISPYRTYYYCSHNDVYGQAIMQSGLCDNVVPFSFDHGYLCGISNPNTTLIIAKRPTDFYLLKKSFDKKVIYIPTCEERRNVFDYKPFNNHDKLITASAAARFYKFKGTTQTNYIDLILNLLLKTGGTHYHYGPIDSEEMEKVQNFMSNNKFCDSKFVLIPWANDISKDMIERNVDIFVEPFPIVSYKITLEVISAGIPVIAYNGLMRMSVCDFIPSNCPKWNNKEEFIDSLSNISKNELNKLSKDCLKYFNENHSKNIVIPSIINNSQFCVPRKVSCTNDTLFDIMDYKNLYNNNSMMVDNNNVSYAQPINTKLTTIVVGEKEEEITEDLTFSTLGSSFISFLKRCIYVTIIRIKLLLKIKL